MNVPQAFAAAGPKDWYRIQAAASDEGDSTSADVYIYDQIGESWWGGGISAKRFAKEIDELDVDTIRLYVNSPGGAAWEGVTIMNALRRHRARVEVTVDGLAASAASVVAMAGDHITMNRGSMLMIHDAWGFAMGNATDMQETAGILDKLSDSLADTYASRTPQDRAYWRDLMKAETWYSAEEAVEAGLADDWADAPEQETAAAAARFDLSKFGFAYAGRNHAPAPPVGVHQTPGSTEPGTTTNKEELTMSDTLKAGLRERLGVTDAEASEETLLEALDQRLEGPADSTTTEVPEGTRLIDANVLAQLQSDAAAGRQALEQQASARREGILQAALKDGRIAPASKEHFAALLEANEEGTTKLLASMPANTVVHTEEIGHQAELDEEDRLAAVAGWDDDAKEA